MRGWAGVALALCVSLAANAERGWAAEQGGERQKGLETRLAGATDDFVAGRFATARAKLEELLAQNPSDEEAWKLREAFGDKILREMALWMREGRTLGDAPQVLLQRALEFDAAKREDPATIDNLVAVAVANTQNIRALHELSILGSLAAPSLVEQLRNTQNDTVRANASFLIAHLGPQMTLPLSQALHGLLNQSKWQKDEVVLAQMIADTLAAIRPRDPRALPVLARFADDQRRDASARAWAKRAAMTVLAAADRDAVADAEPTLPPADRLIYGEAQRLYLGGPRVANEMLDLRGRYYTWNPDARNGKGGLGSVALPDFALDDVYTQDLAYIGMNLADAAADADKPALARDYVERFAPLLARSLLQQVFEAEEYSGVVSQQGVQRADLAEMKKAVAAWLGRLEANRRTAWTMGPERLATALADALVDGKSNVALGALDGIRATARWNGLVNREPLIAALRYSDQRVRHKAAATLSAIGVPPTLPEIADVAAQLCDGATVKTQKVVALLSANDETRREMTAKLMKQGIAVLAAGDGVEGLDLVWQAPYKDAVLIDGELEEFGRLKRRLLESGLIAGTPLPVVVITTRERADRMESAIGDDEGWAVSRVRDANRNVVDTADVKVDELYNRLVKEQADTQAGQRLVAFLTNENLETRQALRAKLLEEAEKRANPAGVSELLAAMEAQNKLDGLTAPSLRAMSANVFLDEELSSKTAMQVLQTLRRDPRSAGLPVAVLTSDRRKKMTEADYKEFLGKGPGFRILEIKVKPEDLLKAVNEMSAANELVKLDFQKNYFRSMAVECACALRGLAVSTRAGGADLKLDPAKAGDLVVALRDAARPIEVRSLIAGALGTWRETSAAKALADVYKEKIAGESEEAVLNLRLACMEALGKVDREAVTRDADGNVTAVKDEAFASLKENALSDKNTPTIIKNAAAAALGKESADVLSLHLLLEKERYNAPLKLVRSATAK